MPNRTALKAIVRAVHGLFAPPAMRVPNDPTTRLQGRSDWNTRWGMAPADPYAPGGPLDDAPDVAPWDRPGARSGVGTIAGYAERTNANTARLARACGPADMARIIDPNWPNPPAWTRDVAGPDKWPPGDDPYATFEPCTVVQDPGLERVRKLTERGLVVPVGTKSDLSNVMELIDRQEAAELHLRSIGMIWDKTEKRWRLPDPYLA